MNPKMLCLGGIRLTELCRAVQLVRSCMIPPCLHARRMLDLSPLAHSSIVRVPEPDSFHKGLRGILADTRALHTAAGHHTSRGNSTH